MARQLFFFFIGSGKRVWSGSNDLNIPVVLSLARLPLRKKGLVTLALCVCMNGMQLVGGKWFSGSLLNLSLAILLLISFKNLYALIKRTRLFLALFICC